MPDTFFTPHQRATAEAAMARIIPTDDTPGAREAGCIDFLDRYLSGIDYIYAKPDGSGFEVLHGAPAKAWMQRIEIMRERYAAGLLDLDARARQRFSADFVALQPQQQDEILHALEQGGTGAPTTLAVTHALADAASPQPALQQTSTEVDLEFLPLLITHTRQGFYADPVYGGNRNRAGWEAIGFPGPASLRDVHTGRYTTLQYFAEGEADKVREFHDGL
jgi:gluconate 2-dehydrogenase gamma chain